MVNRAMVVVLAAVVVAAMAVGVLAGMQFADDGDRAAPATTATTGGEDTAITTATTEGEETATTTVTTGGEDTAITTATTAAAVSPATVDAAAVETAVRDRIDDYRRGEGLDELGTFHNLTAAARFHSDNMAEQGYPTHAARGYTSLERYERFGIADRCRLPDPTAASIRNGQQLELIDRILPDTTSEDDIGRRIARDWIEGDETGRKLDYDAASWVGVGVTVTDDGQVYATANLC